MAVSRPRAVLATMRWLVPALTAGVLAGWVPFHDTRPFPREIAAETGLAATVHLVVPGSDHDGVSTVVVTEDGRPLAFPHSRHDDIRAKGRGRYSHWGSGFYFSSSDGTDPRRNGRTYAAVVRVPPPWRLLEILLLASTVLVALGRAGTPLHAARAALYAVVQGAALEWAGPGALEPWNGAGFAFWSARATLALGGPSVAHLVWSTVAPPVPGRVAPLTPFRRLNAAAVVALLAAFVAVGVWRGAAAVRAGALLTGDQLMLGPAILRDVDPSLLARDPTFGNPAYRFYTPAYRLVAAAALRVLGDATRAHVVLLGLFAGLALLGHSVLGRRLTGSAVAGAMLGGAFLFRTLTPGADFWGVGDLSTALPRTLFVGLTPLVIALYASWAPGPRAPLLFAILGLLANLHPVSGLYLGMAFCVVHVAECGWSRPGLRASALATSAFALAFSPFALTMGRFSAPRAAPLVEAEAAQVLAGRYGYAFTPALLKGAALTLGAVAAALAWTRATRRLGSATAPWWLPLVPAGLVVVVPLALLFDDRAWLPLVPLAAAGYAERCRAGLDARDRLLARFTVALLATTCAIPLAQVVIVRITGKAPFFLELYRGMRFIYLPLFAYGAFFLAGRLRRTGQGRLGSRGLAAISAAAALFLAYQPGLARLRWPVPSVVGGAERTSFLELSDWCRSKTPVDALFLYVPSGAWSGESPLSAAGFRVYAQRGVISSVKDVAFLSYYGPAAVVEWHHRLRSIGQAVATKRPDALLAVAAAQGAAYAILSSDVRPAAREPLFRNRVYAVYAASPGTGR